MDKKMIFGLGVVVLILGYFVIVGGRPADNKPKEEVKFPPTKAITAEFKCDAEKTISATFEKDLVNLKLSDARVLNLNQVVAASGARYANKDESVVFWNKGDTATLEESAKVTFDNCKAVGK